MDIIIIIDGSNDNYDCNDPNITINNNNIYNYNNNSKNVRRLGLGRVQELQLVLLTKKFVVLADPPSIPGPFAEALMLCFQNIGGLYNMAALTCWFIYIMSFIFHQSVFLSDSLTLPSSLGPWKLFRRFHNRVDHMFIMNILTNKEINESSKQGHEQTAPETWPFWRRWY